MQQVGLVNFYVGKMRVEVDLARLHLTIGEDNFDLGALSRAGEAMAELTEEFVETVRVWTFARVGYDREGGEGGARAGSHASPLVCQDTCPSDIGAHRAAK